MKTLRILALTAGLTLLAGAAQAHDYRLGSLEIDHPWSRATPKAAPVGGGYMTITNTGTTADRLISVTAGISDTVEIHEMSVVDGIMKMRALDAGIVIPAGGAVALKPGGYHVMFIGLHGPVEIGHDFKGTLTFEKAGKIEVEFQVQTVGAIPMDHPGQKPMDHSGTKPMGH